MLTRIYVVAVIGLLVCGLSAAADAVTIKVKKTAKGERSKETKSEENIVTITANVNGQAINQEIKGEEKFTFTEEILERPRPMKKATRLKRTYDKAAGQERGQDAGYDLAGKTVLIEKAGDKYTFAVDGMPLTGKAAEKLDKEFNARKSDLEVEDVLLPKNPVKVGEAWTVDPKQLVEVFGDEMVVDEKKIKSTGKLVKVYDKGGHKYGTMEFVLDMPLVKMIDKGGEKAMGAGSFMKMEVTVDACIDGTTSEGSMKGKMSGLMRFTEMGVEITAKLNGSMNSSSELVKK